MFWNFANEQFVHSIWPEAADIDTAAFQVLMSTANALCAAYAPPLPLGDEVPDAWKLAEIFQARHTWSQASGGNSQEYGPDGMSIPTYPLVFAARDLLRPKTSPLSRLR